MLSTKRVGKFVQESTIGGLWGTFLARTSDARFRTGTERTVSARALNRRSVLLTFRALCFTLVVMEDDQPLDLFSAKPGDGWRGTEASYNAAVLRNLDAELRRRGWARKSDGDAFSTELVPLEGWSGDREEGGAQALICIAWNLFGFEKPTWDDPLEALRDAAEEVS